MTSRRVLPSALCSSAALGPSGADAQRAVPQPQAAPALFASLNEIIGRPINEYAFGDLRALLVTLDRVLAWHAAEGDPWSPKARFPEAHAQVTEGLVHMRDEIAADGDTIRAKRRAHALPNRR